jgi:hypothetical protein
MKIKFFKKWRDHDSSMPKRNTHNKHQSFIIIWDPQSPLIIIQHINLFFLRSYMDRNALLQQKYNIYLQSM